MKHNSNFLTHFQKIAEVVLSNIKSETLLAIDTLAQDDAFLDHKLYRMEQILLDSTTSNELKIKCAMAEYREAETYLNISQVF